MAIQKQEYQKSVDVIVIIGHDAPNIDDHKNFAKQIEAECAAKNLTYRIVGDGKKTITLQDIDNLPETNNLLVLAHGSILHDTHMVDNKIKSLELLQKTQAKTHCKNIVYCSCYGGKVIDDMKKYGDNAFLDGTFILAPSSPEAVSLHIQNTKIISKYIERMKPGTNLATFEFVQNCIKTIPETLVTGFQLQEKFLSTTLLRKARGQDKTFFDIKKFGEYQLTFFNEFIDNLLRSGNQNILDRLKTEFPDYDFEDHKSRLNSSDKKSLLQFSITQEEEKEFQVQSLISHIMHNDVEIIDSLLSQYIFEPLLLITAIVITPPKDSIHLDKMVEVILKHKKNARLGTNENNFCPDADISDYFNAFKEYGFIATLGTLIYTPLTLALEKERHEIVKVLLEQGADIYLADRKGTVPANTLKDNKYRHFFIEPLKRANDICTGLRIIEASFLDAGNMTSLQNAHIDVLQKKNIFEQICTQEDDNAFFKSETNIPKNSKVYAAWRDYMTAAAKITPSDLMTFAVDNKLKSAISPLAELTNTPSLYNAVINNDPALVKAHLYGGQSPNETYNDISLLCHAVAKEHTDVINELLKNNVSLDGSPFQIQLLQVAASRASPQVKAALANAGIKANDQQNALDDLFIQAVKLNNFDIATQLIKWGAAPDKQDQNGNSTLHYAALNGNFELVRGLYHWKADFNLRDADGLSALQLASAKSKSVETPESERIWYINIVKTLVKGGANFHLDPEVFRELNLGNAYFVDSNFNNINFSGANLSGANLMGTQFTNANLTGVNFISAKNLTVDQLVSASSIMDIKLDIDFLKAMDSNQLQQLMKKATHDYKAFIKNNDMDVVVTKLLEIINTKEHFLKFGTSFGIPNYKNTQAYTDVIKFGRKIILEELKSQKPYQELNDELQNKLKKLFEANVTTLNFNKFFSSSVNKKTQAEEFYYLSEQPNRPEI